MTKKYDIIIFDWDGTLMDSEATIVICMQKAIATVGMEPLGHQRISNIIGLGLREAIIDLYPKASSKQIQALLDAYRKEFLTSNNPPMPLFDGVTEVLTSLKSQGYYLCVATGKSRSGLNKAMKSSNTDDFFTITRCADETRSKPDPLMLEEILIDLNSSADKALMVGDSSYDMQMAQNINMNRVAVSYGVHDVDTLCQYNPLACLNSISELMTFLENT